jgi:putative heme-binding domain-containing protein
MHFVADKWTQDRRRGIAVVSCWLLLGGVGTVQNALGAPAAGTAPDPQALAAQLTNVSVQLPQRKLVLQGLLQTETGAGLVLQAAQDGLLPMDLRLPATLGLHYSTWAQLTNKAAEILPLPLTHNSVPIPRMSELLAMKGDAFNGAKLFAKPEVNCINCHLTGGRGMEIGPDLSDVGLRMTREDLFENILEPNARVTEGYEAWQLILKNEDEVYGLLVGETAQEIAIKDLKGTITKYQKSDVASRLKLPVSIMPVGLQQGMNVRDLVDLVEYLTTMKTPKKK